MFWTHWMGPNRSVYYEWDVNPAVKAVHRYGGTHIEMPGFTAYMEKYDTLEVALEYASHLLFL